MKRALAAIALVIATFLMASASVFADSYDESYATAQHGGTLVSSDGRLVWTVEGGAYSRDMVIRYYPYSPDVLPARPANTAWVGQTFTMRLYEKDGMRPISLDWPATFVVHYDPADLSGRDEATMRLVRYTDRWIDVASTVDTANHTVTAQSQWPGNYGLLVADTTPAAPEPSVSAPTDVQAIPMNSSITGRVFYDRDGNGVMDGEDFPIAGAGLRISSGDWSATTTSDGSGEYSFWVLRESDYAVEVVVGDEWAFTTPKVVSGIRVTGQADSRGTADFGMWYKLPE